MTKEQLDAINKFTRRELSEDELYVFPLILCDNDIDRDIERFSDDALEKLCSLFVGKTGIFDHDPKSSGQTARIFSAELYTDSSRTTKYNAPYKCLKAYAYMVRTDGNRGLITEIDGGIKKEVSISCAASRKICSVCGCDKTKSSCNHLKGKIYNGKLCHVILDDVTDAYEWSFVAVPAQVNAGVSKRFVSEERNVVSQPKGADFLIDEGLRHDICRLAFFNGGTENALAVSKNAESMNTAQLTELKASLEKQLSDVGVTLQLNPQNCGGEDESVSDFSF